MTLEQLAQVGEFIGGIAVILSLIFVGLQIRQNTKSVRAQSELVLSQRFGDFHGRVNEHPELSALYDKGISSPDALTSDEVRRFRWFMAEVFLIYEGAYHLHRHGELSRESIKTRIQSVKALLENPVLKEWWEEGMTPLSREFVAFVNTFEPDPTYIYKVQAISTQRKAMPNNTMESDT